MFKPLHGLTKTIGTPARIRIAYRAGHSNAAYPAIGRIRIHRPTRKGTAYSADMGYMYFVGMSTVKLKATDATMHMPRNPHNTSP